MSEGWYCPLHKYYHPPEKMMCLVTGGPAQGPVGVRGTQDLPLEGAHQGLAGALRSHPDCDSSHK